jgi:hypothetical protein
MAEKAPKSGRGSRLPHDYLTPISRPPHPLFVLRPHYIVGVPFFTIKSVLIAGLISSGQSLVVCQPKKLPEESFFTNSPLDKTALFALYFISFNRPG